jgi:DNA repair photolyase
MLPAIRLGGMTDCFQACEKEYKVTYEAIKALNEKRQPYLIVTKSDLVVDDEYLSILDKDLANIQVTVTCTDDETYKHLGYEKAPLPSKRIQAIETLYNHGFDVQLRLSPFIPKLVDYDVLASIKCDKILIEFLRINSFIIKWFGDFINIDEYTIKQSGYKHLPLSKKLELLSYIKGYKEMTICEDESEAYNYWKDNFNHNPNDCCNLGHTIKV